MALSFTPPKVEERIKVSLTPEAHGALKKSVEEYNQAHGSGSLSLDAAASEILNKAILAAEKKGGSRRKKNGGE